MRMGVGERSVGRCGKGASGFFHVGCMLRGLLFTGLPFVGAARSRTELRIASSLADRSRPAWIDIGVSGSYLDLMNSVITAPTEWIESVSNLRFPPKADDRLQHLMERNNEGLLTEGEREEFEALVELSETLSLVRAEAWQILSRSPA